MQMDVSFAGEWEEEKSNVDFISRGRRTEAYVQRPVAIDSDGMENITDFWNAAGKDEEISQVPTPLFKSNQKSTISLSHSIQDPPSEIPVSPEISENENIEPEIPSESISFQTPKPPNPKPNKTRPNRLPRYVDTNSPSDGMTPAIKAAHSIRNVRATPPPTPSTPQITPPSAKTESPHQKNNTPKAPQLSVGVQPTPVQKYEPPPQRDSVFSRLKNYKFDEPQNKHEENNERIRIPPDNKRRISRLDSETTEQEIPSIIPQRTEEETTKRKFDDFKRPNFEVWKGNINNFEEMAIRQRNNDFNELLEDTYNVKRIPTLPNRISRIEDNSMRIDDLIQPIEVEVKQQIPKRFNNEQRKDKTVTIGDAYSVNIPKRSSDIFDESFKSFGHVQQNEKRINRISEEDTNPQISPIMSFDNNEKKNIRNVKKEEKKEIEIKRRENIFEKDEYIKPNYGNNIRRSRLNDDENGFNDAIEESLKRININQIDESDKKLLNNSEENKVFDDKKQNQKINRKNEEEIFQFDDERKYFNAKIKSERIRRQNDNDVSYEKEAEENMKRVQFNENETFFGNRTQNERNDNEEREQFNESRTFFRKRANKERNDNEERDQFNESRTFFRNRANKERNDNEEREQFDENRTFFGNRANKERNDNEEREQFDESRTFFGNREQNIKRVHFDNSQNETTKLQSNLYVNETEQNIKRVHFDNAQNETTKVQSNLYVNETEQNIKRVHFDDAQNEIETPRIERAEPAIFKSEPQPTNGISRLTRIVDTSAVSSMITTPMNEMQMLSEEINNIKTNGTNNSFRNNVTKFEFNPSTTNIRNSPSPSDNETSIIAEASDIESPIPLDISDDDVQITEGINEEREQLLTSPPPSNITNVSDSESSELNLSDVPFSAINSPPSKSDNVPLSVPLWDESDNDQPKDDENLQQQHQKNDKNVKQRNSRRKRILDGISVTLTEDDNLPIALRKKRRPKTKPLRFWMGEKIIYHPDENGCLTKSGVIEINEKSPDESTLVHHKSTKNTRKEALSAFEVIPKRIEPAAEKTEFIDRFQGIENSIVVSSEVMVHPNQIFKIVATKERIVIHIASGKAELVSRGKRWKVSSGGTVFISKGDECTFKNNDDKVPLRLFRVNVE